MAFRRGDVILIPFPYTDLSATKTRPAVVVSSDAYHTHRLELLLAYISSQASKFDPETDYFLSNWSAVGLLRPSFVRPRIAAIEPSLVVFRVGSLGQHDMGEVDRVLKRALAL